MILIILFYLYLVGVAITILCMRLTFDKNDFKRLSFSDLSIDFFFFLIVALGSWMSLYYIFKN